MSFLHNLFKEKYKPNPDFAFTDQDISISGVKMAINSYGHHYAKLIGKPSGVFEPNRNRDTCDIVNVFDNLGIVLLQNCSSNYITGIEFHYSPIPHRFSPKTVYKGLITLFGKEITTNYKLSQITTDFPDIETEETEVKIRFQHNKFYIVFVKSDEPDKISRIGISTKGYIW